MALIIAFLNFASGLANIVNNFYPPYGQLVANIITFVAKVLEFVVAAIEFRKVAKTKPGSIQYRRYKNTFYKALIDMVTALLDIFFSNLTGIIGEGLHLIRKIISLIEAKQLLADTQKRFNYFEALGQTQIQTSNDLNAYSICKANYFNIKQFYELFGEIAKSENSILKKYNLKNISSIWNEISKEAKNNNSKKINILKDFKEDIKQLCEKNIQFCSRNLSVEFFKNLNFSDEEIQVYINRAIYGPYTHIVVAKTSEESLSFIQMGFEPIHNGQDFYLLGCRMCSNKKAIRYITVSKEHSDLSRIIAGDEAFVKQRGNCPVNNVNTQPCKKIFGDDDVACNKISYKSLRIDTSNVVIYEKVSIKEMTQAASKLFPVDPEKKFDILPQYGIWDARSSQWVNCSGAQGHPILRGLCKDCNRGLFTNDQSSIKIDRQGKLGLDLLNSIPLSNELKLQSYPLESKLSFFNAATINKNERAFFVLDKTTGINVSVLVEGTHRIHNNYAIFASMTKKPNEWVKEEVIVKPGHYNWITMDSGNASFYKDSHNIQRVLGGTAPIITPFKIKRVEDDDVTDWQAGQTSDLVHTYTLISFKPFNPPENSLSLEEDMRKSKEMCDFICAQNTVHTKKTSCNFMEDLSHNKLVFGNNHGDLKTEDRIREHFNNNVSKIQDFRKTVNKVKVLNAVLNNKNKEFTLDNLRLYSELTKTDSQSVIHINIKLAFDKQILLCFIKKSQKGKKYASSVTIKQCGDFDKETEDLSTHVFKMKTRDIGSNIHFFLVKDKSAGRDKLSQALIELNDHYLVERASGLFVDSNFFNFIYVQPLPSSGFVPFEEYSQSTIKGKFTKNCKPEFYDSLSSTHCYKTNNICSELDLSPAITSDSFKTTFNDNLFKSQSQKFNGVSNPSYEIKNFLKKQIASCEKTNFFIPVKFHSDKSKKHLFRSLNVENGLVKETFEIVGPGIRSIYYIQLNYNFREDQNNIKVAEKYGYVIYRQFNVTLFQKEYTITLWVAYDYRLTQRRSDICILCSESLQRSP